MITFIVALTFITVLLACGIVVNMYLYTHGLFRARQMRRARRFAELDEDYFSTYLNGRYDFTGDYVRRWLFFVAAILIVVCLAAFILLMPVLK